MTSQAKPLPSAGGSFTRARDGSLKKVPVKTSAPEEKANIAGDKDTTSSEKEA